MTHAPFIPDGLTITTLSKTINWKGHACTDYSGKPTGNYIATFEFTLEITLAGRTMQTPYSGGCLAFLTDEVKRQIRESKDPDAFHAQGAMEGYARRRGIGIDKTAGIKYIFAHSPIKPLDVLYSLVSDTDVSGMDFEEFCDSYGYDTDSRKAHATWLKTQELSRSFRYVIGDEALMAQLVQAFKDY